jgi:hypothetical protein
MVTLGGFIEFEHAIPKMAEASSRATFWPSPARRVDSPRQEL